VGSGSFLIGMLTEIIRLRKTCYLALTLNPSPDRAQALGEGLKGTYRQMAADAMVHLARDLRQRETPAEDILWECLRDRRLAGLKFRRQHPIANTSYVVDFFCYEHKLVVELDGEIHQRQRSADTQRQQEIEALGLRVVRFANDAIFHDLETVLTTITQTALDSPLPAQRSGEGPGVRAEIPSALLADWKEAIIRDTLYGVDIKPEAIEIAQLRLWLALVVDQTLEQARPLPNLDYKLMAGNSLIETIDGEPVLGESAQAMLGADVAPAQPTLGLFEADRERFKLDELRAQFFRARPEERKKLRADITAQERRIVATSLREKAEAQQQIIDRYGRLAAQTNGKLKASDERKLKAAVEKLTHVTRLQDDMAQPDYTPPFFLYRLHFSEVFERKGGFDVVVANPPYVRQELIGSQKPELEMAYPAVYAGTADLYVYFFARSFALLHPKGQLSFITPNKFMRANYGKKLRGYLAEKVRLQTLIDFGDLPIFDATTYPMITLASKQSVDSNKVNVLQITDLDETENLHAASEQAFQLPQNTLTDEGWQLSSPRVRALMDKLTKAGMPLGQYVDGRIYYGIKTGLNEAFIIDEAKRAELITADPNSAEIIRPYLRGRDVKRWHIQPAGLYMIAIQNSNDATANNAWGASRTEREALRILEATYPAIYAHMVQYEEKLRPRADQGKWWWELRACAYYPEFEKPKIIYQEIATFQSFAYTELEFYTNNKCFIIPDGDLNLLATLNSKLAWFFLGNTVSKLQGGAFAMQAIYLEQLPIPDPPDELRQRIAALAQQCLDAAQDAPDTLPTLEAELNTLVYQAYGLDADDIAVIEGSLGGQEAASSSDVEEDTENEE
ncbi:MAG: DUF559 domain-containing protein, partial [Anaerolineae bacterium]|nr:DUF559 domain-containing protein [Anaerolineae bacterium]